MEKKSIIIFWKWDKDNYSSGFNVEDSDDFKLYSSKISEHDIDGCISFITNINSENTLVLLHTNNPNNFVDVDKKKVEDKLKVNKSVNAKVRLFGGGSDENHPIYYNSGKYPKGILGNSDIEENAINNGKLKKDNFEFVWDHYWNKLDLEYQKKKIINLWLPLAIDIQGLSEVQNETHKADKYFNEIKMETDYLNLLKSFPNEDFPNWEEIKNGLGNGYREFNPVVLVDEIMIKNFTDFKTKYFSDPNFLPNWLQKVVRILDEKIKAQNSKD